MTAKERLYEALVASNDGCGVAVTRISGLPDMAPVLDCAVEIKSGDTIYFDVLEQDVDLFPDDLPQLPAAKAMELFRDTGRRLGSINYSPSDSAWAADVLNAEGEIIGFLLAPNGASGVQDLKVMVDEEG
ncbi:hypothetical protein [Agathobaculum sp.]|jgi:hypothetical protein|uniref:hypothetical protein n=1 Tax=Agathobaculum sp. TaxID=2048138 RepID=UPI00307B4087